MHSDKRQFPFKGVVIIADLIADEDTTPIYFRRDLEQTDPETLNELSDTIKGLGLKVQHYDHPRLLAENASQHRNDIVLSIFGGRVSRNRMALVPAVCESMGLSYIGPDAYGRIICQDKEVSKAIAGEAGLKTAPHRILREPSDVSKLAEFPLPYVVKPLLEGSSIGIGPENLVNDHAFGRNLASELLKRFQQPIMVEAFIPGREVSFCFVDGPEKTAYRSLAESVWLERSDHFDNHLFDSFHKSHVESAQTVRDINHELLPQTSEAMERLLVFLAPLGYGRIDGKLNGNDFIFLEVTPDAWLGSSGVFMNSFKLLGRSPGEIMTQILLSGRPNHQYQSTNG